ncbi:DUF2290 domain-containing protein [Alishewanella jeotgali]|jgi:hypothetical protein|uniref:DUF2290 domain-containing protein n=1 Tax=Alishewanella jeotgali KCTC 22429 TaxID=1129374 RepID=H3ZFW8_9ALTE|nr:DUF2290 domain-containing protein [Alishewanella jeotgali]EHR40476.1 hypothetical protein AJE_11324 [Alishewanella jeotgali KCTC 22429]
MVSQSFNQNIRETISLAEKFGLLFQAGSCVSLVTPPEVKFMSRRAVSYREVYDTIVSFQSFNLMLEDRSFFQFTEVEANSDVRLVYYPNPYQFVEYLSERREILKLLESEEITDIEYEQFTSEADFTSDIPVIRYDLSLNQHCKLYHPAAHFHIGFHAENRWPVDRVLTPKAFFLKTLYSYYQRKWKTQEQNTIDEIENVFDMLYREEIRKNCPLISEMSPKHFDRIEHERLHFR